jgi:hypothetical protein
MHNSPCSRRIIPLVERVIGKSTVGTFSEKVRFHDTVAGVPLLVNADKGLGLHTSKKLKILCNRKHTFSP